MSMFSALVPEQPAVDFGTESFEEIVDNYCAALEDVESEIAGLEELSEGIDNAGAFAAAIESCGATPALLQFGYSVDSSFEQLIGRAAPSDFAQEDMQEFGSFALESIKGKLQIAWEHVKTFILRLWEKIKEFGRWCLRLLDRKVSRLEKIVKGEGGALPEGFNDKQFKKVATSAVLTDAFKKLAVVRTKEICGDPNIKVEVNASVIDALKIFGWAADTNGGIKKSGDGSFKAMKGSETGFKTKDDIKVVATAALNLLKGRADFDKLVKQADKSKAEIDKAAAIKSEGDTTKEAERVKQLQDIRKAAMIRSKVIVALSKEMNNSAAAVITIAAGAGL